MGTEASDLAEACLSHLNREEAALQGTLDTLRVVRAAALAGDVPRLEALHDRQEEAARLTRQLGADRERLRAQIASRLRVSVAEATLERLAAHIGGSSAEILRATASRVRELASHVDRLNLANATVLGYCLGFTRRVLRDLTGGGTPAESYGPDGTVTESPCGPLLSAKG
jgi:hypothetical protein